MKIATLLPYKEDYSPSYAGAVSIHVANLFNHSKYKKDITNPIYRNIDNSFLNALVKANMSTPFFINQGPIKVSEISQKDKQLPFFNE